MSSLQCNHLKCYQKIYSGQHFVADTNHKMVVTCFFGGPLNSSFILCSRIHTTMPMTMKKAAVTAHICKLNGRRKAHAPVLSFLNGATTTSPDVAYGCVKSTIFVLFVTMAMSPTAASKNCKQNKERKMLFNIKQDINVILNSRKKTFQFSSLSFIGKTEKNKIKFIGWCFGYCKKHVANTIQDLFPLFLFFFCNEN